MRRIYKEWTIQTTKIANSTGIGINAIFYIAKNNGLKSNIQEYTIYGEKSHLQVVEKVQQIIDLLYL